MDDDSGDDSQAHESNDEEENYLNKAITDEFFSELSSATNMVNQTEMCKVIKKKKKKINYFPKKKMADHQKTPKRPAIRLGGRNAKTYNGLPKFKRFIDQRKKSLYANATRS